MAEVATDDGCIMHLNARKCGIYFKYICIGTFYLFNVGYQECTKIFLPLCSRSF